MTLPTILKSALPIRERIKAFEALTADGEDDFVETLFIKVDGRFKHRRVERGIAHEFIFPDNRHRDYGFSYIHAWNLITVDEYLTKTDLEDLVQEVEHRLKAKPDAIWNGWFTREARWIIL